MGRPICNLQLASFLFGNDRSPASRRTSSSMYAIHLGDGSVMTQPPTYVPTYTPTYVLTSKLGETIHSIAAVNRLRITI